MNENEKIGVYKIFINSKNKNLEKVFLIKKSFNIFDDWMIFQANVKQAIKDGEFKLNVRHKMLTTHFDKDFPFINFMTYIFENNLSARNIEIEILETINEKNKLKLEKVYFKWLKDERAVYKGLNIIPFLELISEITELTDDEQLNEWKLKLANEEAKYYLKEFDKSKFKRDEYYQTKYVDFFLLLNRLIEFRKNYSKEKTTLKMLKQIKKDKNFLYLEDLIN